MDILQYVFIGVQAVFLLIMVYLYLLALVCLWPPKRDGAPPSPRTEFGIVVPAHNEAEVIRRTLSSLQDQDYPDRLFTVYVVADNCTDDTAALADRAGVRCLERCDGERRGKGWALQWAFETLKADGVWPEAFVVIDADTCVAPNFLRLMDEKIQGGAKVLQGYYDVLHPDRSTVASLSYFGFALNRLLRYRGRTRLGWTTNLLGNGMCFHRDVIREHGWPATTIVEDLEYGMMLLLKDVRVVFVPQAKIYAEIPDSFGRSRTQRVRWDLGKFVVRNMYLPKLLKAAFKRRDVAFLDAAMELIIPPFSLFVVIVVGCFLLYYILFFRNFNFLFSLWLVILGALGGYVLLGLVVARAKGRMYRHLLCAPFFLLWRIYIVLSGVLNREKRDWIKTKRRKLRETVR